MTRAKKHVSTRTSANRSRMRAKHPSGLINEDFFGGENRLAVAQKLVAQMVAKTAPDQRGVPGRIRWGDVEMEVKRRDPHFKADSGPGSFDLNMKIKPLYDAMIMMRDGLDDEASKKVISNVEYGAGSSLRHLGSEEAGDIVRRARELYKAEKIGPSESIQYPFKQRALSSGRLLREFSHEAPIDDLVWHRDREDRTVRALEGRGWALQLDGGLPQPIRLGEAHHIPAGTWHRLLRRPDATALRLVVELKKGDRVKHGGRGATVRVPDARGDLVGIDPAGPDDMEMVPEDELEPLREKDGSGKGKGAKGEPAPRPRSYGAPEGSKRDKQLDATAADLKSGDPEREKRAWRRRDRMEKEEREKKGWKNKPRPDTKTEALDPLTETELREMIQDILGEELSKKLKATLRKKAEDRGLTPGSVEAEYKKGLAAWGTSGSRPGVSQHAWAMARVNAATPSKPWATVKKSKKKKKK